MKALQSIVPAATVIDTLPALIAGAGKQASLRFLGFFTVNIRNAAIGRTKKLGPRALSRVDLWYMVQRRVSDASIETSIGCHAFRATGIIDYLTNGGKLEIAQRVPGHSNANTIGLYDRRKHDISVSEVEGVGI